MTIEQRLRQLVFNGVQEFDGKAPALGIFTDPVTRSSFAVRLDHPIGPALDELRRIWGEDLGAQPTQEWHANEAADRAYRTRHGE